MILAVDFDGTIVEHDYPGIGKPVPGAFSTLKKLKHRGHRLILWTCREGAGLEEAVRFCEENGLTFESHNENTVECNGNRKVMADYYIDDRNVCGFPGWKNIYDFILKEEKKLEALTDIYNLYFKDETIKEG